MSLFIWAPARAAIEESLMLPERIDAPDPFCTTLGAQALVCDPG